MVYQGSCHCGGITFSVKGEIDKGLACNCSICSRKGSLLWFVPRSDLQLQTPESAMATYTFNNHVIKHYFCPACGIHPFGEAVDPNGQLTAAVNLRCIEGIDLDAIEVTHYDGRSR